MNKQLLSLVIATGLTVSGKNLIAQTTRPHTKEIIKTMAGEKKATNSEDEKKKDITRDQETLKIKQRVEAYNEIANHLAKEGFNALQEKIESKGEDNGKGLFESMSHSGFHLNGTIPENLHSTKYQTRLIRKAQGLMLEPICVQENRDDKIREKRMFEKLSDKTSDETISHLGGVKEKNQEILSNWIIFRVYNDEGDIIGYWQIEFTKFNNNYIINTGIVDATLEGRKKLNSLNGVVEQKEFIEIFLKRIKQM